MTDTHDGGCVCGTTRYRTSGNPIRVNVCHCTWCQRRTGSAFSVIAVFRPDQIQLTGAAPAIYRHHSDESGRWLDSQFCPRCGTNIGFTTEWVPDAMAIDAGTFDDPSWITPARFEFRYIYMRSARCWAAVPAGAQQFDEHFRT